MGTGKYGPLAEYLGACRRAESGTLTLILSFNQIEQILGCKLPPSARKSASSWGNDLGHAHARAWIAEGWVTRNLSLAEQRLTFASDTKAIQKANEASALELESLIFGSRKAAQDQFHSLKTRLKANPPKPTRDERLLSRMAEALHPLGCDLEIKTNPPPARGHRTRPGAGLLTARCGRDGRSRMRMTFVGGHIEVDVMLSDNLGAPARLPADRANDAWLFAELWEGDHPWLVTSAGSAADRDSPLTLCAYVSLAGTPSDAEYRRVFAWLGHETDAFEDGLRKILWRKRPITAHRAMDLARKRLARHARPPTSLVRSHAASAGTASR
jgi:hypothetical protein